jgi:MFS family permease
MTAVAVGLARRTVPETRPPISENGHNDKPISRQLIRLMVIVFTTGISAAMIAPIYLIYLQDKFTTDIATLAWAFLPAGIIYSVLPSRLGRLGDRWGRVPLMAVGMAGAGVLSLALPRLPGLVWLIGLYTLTAVGWAMADPAEAALVADLAGTGGRGRAYGLYTFANSLGATIGPLLGGWLYDAVGQAVPFYINGIVLFFSAVWALLAFRQQSNPGFIYHE